MAQVSLPNPHYHACRPVDVCDMNCARCGKLVEEFSRLPTPHFSYGCCHKCPEHGTCDFKAKHEAHIKTLVSQAHPRGANPYEMRL